MTEADKILQQIARVTERNGFAFMPPNYLEKINPLHVEIDPDTHNEAGEVAVRVTDLGNKVASRLPAPLAEAYPEGSLLRDTFPVPREAEYLYHEAHIPLDKPLCNSPFLADHQRSFKKWWHEQIVNSNVEDTRLFTRQEVLRLLVDQPGLKRKIDTAMLHVEDREHPMPRTNHRGRLPLYPFKKMEVGQCSEIIKKPLDTIRCSVYYANQKLKPKKFTVREDDGGVRIWRKK